MVSMERQGTQEPVKADKEGVCVYGFRRCAPRDLAMRERVNNLPGLDEEVMTQIGVAQKGIPASHQTIIY